MGGFYRSAVELFRSLPPEFLGMDRDAITCLADAAEQHGVAERDAILLPFRRPDEVVRETLHQAGVSEAAKLETYALLAGAEDPQATESRSGPASTAPRSAS